MTDTIAHRGPDGQGHWISQNQAVGLGHRRLSIIDISPDGAQPMHYLNNRYTVVFNGEIYNYRELRDILKAKGYTFNTQSDTEVLIAAYDHYREDCLQQFDGMFAFALWDDHEKTIFCARDRFGEKPFFYSTVPGKHFVFGSEIKCLFKWGIEHRVDYNMFFNYMAYDVIETNHDRTQTFYQGVSRLEASHYLKIFPNGKITKTRYWKLNDQTDYAIRYEDAVERFRELFDVSVNRRLRSDVPVGTSLSGGLDSSSVVCTINKAIDRKTGTQKTFTARFSDAALDEGRFIDFVKAKTQIESHDVWPNAEGLIADFDKLFWHQEEPFGSASVFAQWKVMELAKLNNVTVLLDGQGADETLAGYEHYFNVFLRELYNRDRKRFQSELACFEDIYNVKYPIDSGFLKEALFPKLMRFLGRMRRFIMTPEYLSNFHPDFARSFRMLEPPFESFKDLNKALMFSTETYGLEKLLRFVDRSSMAFSRETRLPFLSHELVEFAFSLPSEFKIRNGWTKSILRHAMEPVLPKEICWRKDKLGFQPPQRDWLSSPKMAGMIHDAKSYLVKEKIIKDASRIDDWKAIMGHKFLTAQF